MAERIDILSTDFDRASAITNAVTALNEGNLIIAPLEFGYVFIADAFNHKAVQSIHRLRYDARGVATQVIVGDIDTARGITREFGETTKAL